MFEVGQKVVCMDAEGCIDLVHREVYTAVHVSDTKRFIQVKGSCGIYRASRFAAEQESPQPPKAGESDPNGTDAHAPGAKLDAGKVRPSLVIEGMARALWAVAEVASFGAAKYTPGGWVLVPQGQERYADAGYRHLLKRAMGEQADADSKLTHLAHEAWNSLTKLDLYLREEEKRNDDK